MPNNKYLHGILVYRIISVDVLSERKGKHATLYTHLVHRNVVRVRRKGVRD